MFIVDDVAFIQAEHGHGHRPARSSGGTSASSYYLETRGDVLLRNKDVFRYWKRLGLEYMFLGLEAIDEEGLKLFRKRDQAVDELRGAGVRAVAGNHRRHQHHRRPGLGRGALPA